MKTSVRILIILFIIAAAGYWAYDQLEKNYLIGGSREERAARELEEKKNALERIYSEKFDPAIDPKEDAEEHKNIYDRAEAMVRFPILEPETIPEGYKFEEVYAIAPSPNTDPSSLDKGGFWMAYRNENKVFKLTEGGEGTKSLGTGNRIKFEKGAMMMSWILKNKNKETNIIRFGGTPQYEYTVSSLELGEKELIDIAAEIIGIKGEPWEYQELWFRPSTIIESGIDETTQNE